MSAAADRRDDGRSRSFSTSIRTDRSPEAADCDQNKVLDLFDFLCFQNAFVAEEDYADCDNNSVFDLFDFLCYQNAFVAGCQ